MDSEEITTESQFEPMRQKLRNHNKPLLHYIFTLTLAEGSFLDLSSLEGWNKFIEMHSDIFNEFFKCSITDCNRVKNTELFNTEHFILEELGESSHGMGRCILEGVEFDYFTNGKDFEVILDPSDLESKNCYYKLDDIFGWWAGENLVKSLNLDEFLNKARISRYENERKDSFRSFNPFLDLEFYSFVVFTYPENMDIKKFLIEKKFLAKQVSEDFWITYNGAHGAFIRKPSSGHPPFGDCYVHVRGHIPSEYSYEIKEHLRILHRHMKFWSMVKVIENFMGMMNSFSNISETIKPKVRKIEILEGLLFEKNRKHDTLESLRNMRQSINQFLYYGLKSDFRGLERDVSEQYLPRYIAGGYLSRFNEDEIEFTREVIANATEENVKILNDEFLQMWLDFQERIKYFIDTTIGLERMYYQEYQLKLVEKTQELTMLSIIIAILIFTITKILHI